jgi:hypothetical protein
MHPKYHEIIDLMKVISERKFFELFEMSKSSCHYLLKNNELEESLVLSMMVKLRKIESVTLSKNSHVKKVKKKINIKNVERSTSIYNANALMGHLEDSVIERFNTIPRDKNSKNLNTNEMPVEVVLIKLDSKAKSWGKLTNLFLLPEHICDLLDSANQPLNTVEEAKLFLLTKFKDIISLASQIEREFFIAQLTIYLKFWLKNKEVPARFSFFENCSLQRNGSSVWIKGLGHLSVENPVWLSHQICRGWHSYLYAFDIVKINKAFYVQIKVHSKDASTNGTGSHHSEFGQGINTSSFLDQLDNYLKFIDKVSSKFTKTDYFRLEGREVLGGLPSLGKRR